MAKERALTESVGFIKSKVKIPSVQIKTRSGETLTLFGGYVMGHFKRSYGHNRWEYKLRARCWKWDSCRIGL